MRVLGRQELGLQNLLQVGFKQCLEVLLLAQRYRVEFLQLSSMDLEDGCLVSLLTSSLGPFRAHVLRLYAFMHLTCPNLSNSSATETTGMMKARDGLGACREEEQVH
jgi:hypothetical protein